jgi:opacity protein-like surface antigen
MKRFVLGLAAAVALSAVAFAADKMEPRYGNTVVLTAANGQVTKLMYNKDGSMDVVMPDGAKAKGTWAMEGDKLCVTSSVGPAAGQKQCNPFAEHKVGDEWEIPLPDGTKLKAKLVAGRS